EEDAADQIAAFIALQFGKDNARTIIKGFSNYWGYSAFVSKADPGPSLNPDDPNYRNCANDAFCHYADEHGTASQRYYNVLCMALNDQHRDMFKDILDANLLPEGRLQRCNKEYKQVQLAFRKTLLPFIDPVQAEKVMKRTWFTGKELQEKRPDRARFLMSSVAATRSAPPERSPVPQLHGDDHRHQREGDGARHDQGPVGARCAVDEPEEYAGGERQIGRQRQCAGIPVANHLDGLWQPADRGENRADGTDHVDQS